MTLYKLRYYNPFKTLGHFTLILIGHKEHRMIYVFLEIFFVDNIIGLRLFAHAYNTMGTFSMLIL